MPVQNAQEATVIVREYSSRAFQVSYWKEAVEVDLDRQNNQWHVVFVASPGFTAPDSQYEAFVDAETGSIVHFKKLDSGAL